MSRINRIQSAKARLAAPGAWSRLGWVNGGLAIAALALLLYYVVQVNALAAQAWQLQDARTRLATLEDERNALAAQRSALDDRQTLQNLAKRQGMVPAGTVGYLVEDHSVAAAR